MRDRIERFVLLPFSMGCVSESSIAVGPQFPNRSKRNANSTPTSIPEEEEEYEDDEECLSDENLKSPLNLLAAPKFQRLFKNLKNLSQLFVYKDDEMEDEDMGMEIGFPTDVKHVTHIGIDGSATSILSKGWDNMKEAEFNPRSSFSMLSKDHWDNMKEAELNPRASVRLDPCDATEAEKMNLKGPSETAYV